MVQYVTGLDDFRLQPALREIPGVESEEKVRASRLGAEAECVVLQPQKVFLDGPTMEQIGARNPAWTVLLPETGDSSHDNVGVHHRALLSLFRPRLQR